MPVQCFGKNQDMFRRRLKIPMTDNVLTFWHVRYFLFTTEKIPIAMPALCPLYGAGAPHIWVSYWCPYHCCHPNLFAFFILQVHQRPEQTCCLFSIVKHTFRACSNRYGIILRMLLEWQGGPTKTPCSKKYTLFFLRPRFVDIVGVPVIGFWASRHEGMQYNQGFLHMWCSLGGTWILQNPELWKFRILFGFAWPCFLNGCVFFWFVALRV